MAMCQSNRFVVKKRRGYYLSGATPMAPHRPHDHFAAGFGPFRATSTPFSPIIIFRPIFDHLPYPLLSPSDVLPSPNGDSPMGDSPWGIPHGGFPHGGFPHGVTPHGGISHGIFPLRSVRYGMVPFIFIYPSHVLL